MSIDYILLNFRNSNRLSQAEMAAKFGVSQPCYHKWESGIIKIPLERYADISRICEVSLLDILPPDFKDQLFSSQ